MDFYQEKFSFYRLAFRFMACCQDVFPISAKPRSAGLYSYWNPCAELERSNTGISSIFDQDKICIYNEKGREAAQASPPCAEISSCPQLERAVQQTGLSAEAAAAAFVEASAASAIVVVIVVVVSSDSVRAEHGDKTDQPGVVKDRIRVVRIPVPIPVVISTVTHNQFLQFFHCGGFPIRTTSYVGGCRNVPNRGGLFFQIAGSSSRTCAASGWERLCSTTFRS